MSIPTDLLPTTCDVYRPFGGPTPTYSNVRCRLVPDLSRGRPPGGAGLAWTHYMVLDAAADVRDGCTRAAGAPVLNYTDGDEVRVPSGAAGPRFVVVWVEAVESGTPREHKRAYLMRDTA
jgi:hypothetical protein